MCVHSPSFDQSFLHLLMHTDVAIFCTNVEDRSSAMLLLRKLERALPCCRINFDLQDCDRILRVAGDTIDTQLIIAILEAHQFHCSALK